MNHPGYLSSRSRVKLGIRTQRLKEIYAPCNLRYGGAFLEFDVDSMCGINGFSWGDANLIKEMNDVTQHRGPDDRGYFVDERVSLGNLRLAIIDISPAGHQPMKYERDGREVWITYNGEIYNHQEVREELEKRNYVFRSHSDTEVILASYLEWGSECVQRFVGMWAFVIYEKKRNTLFFSRDRFGIKPFYYYNADGRIIFSSEIRGILTHPIDRRPNEDVIFDFLYYDLVDHGEETFFQGISRLLPGHNAEYDLTTRKLNVWQYYNLANEVGKGAEKPNPDMFKEVFYEAVRKCIVSDVPVGSCLSGGLDSSSIVCAMREISADAQIRTFSLVVPGDKLDESKHQQEVVQASKVENHTIGLYPDDVIANLENLVSTQEEPFHGLTIMASYMVMKLARQNDMKVLLDGQGGDEILAGYDYLAAFYFYELLRRGRLFRLISEMSKSFHRPHTKLYAYFFGLLLPKQLRGRVVGRQKKYLSKDFVRKHAKRLERRFERKSLNDALIEAITYYPLPSLLRIEDKNSMHWSVESRVPFLDHRLVEYSLRSPSDAKIRDGAPKFLLRKGMEGVVPEAIISRKDKIGFAVPEAGLRQSRRVQELILGIINSNEFKNRPYWNWDAIEKMSLKDNSSPRSRVFVADNVWMAILLELWLRAWIDPPVTPINRAHADVTRMIAPESHVV